MIRPHLPRTAWSRWALALATVVIAAASALAATQLTRGETGRQASAPIERKVVFVAGLQSSSDCDDPPTDGNGTSWGGLWQAIASGLGLEPDDLFVYSYSGDYECDGAPPDSRARYTGTDTCGTIDPEGRETGSARRFGAWFHRLTAAHPDARFDIIAHSLGGVVVASWAVQADEDDLARVRSFVALSSPLQGRPGAGLAAGIEIPGQVCFGRPVLLDLDPSSPVIAAINSPEDGRICGQHTLASLISTRIPTLTIRNARDLLVPPEFACLPGGEDLLIDDDCEPIGHGCTRTNAEARKTIAEWLQTGEP